jgi:hypothetical protein
MAIQMQLGGAARETRSDPNSSERNTHWASGRETSASCSSPCAQLATLEAFFTGSIEVRVETSGIVSESLPLLKLGGFEWGPS